MVSCKHCATANSLDSTFCKKCGTPLPEVDLQEAAQKLELVIAEGVTLYNVGKYDEAMDVAETAVQSNPSSVGALALKGDCHAQRGEVAEAIECYEAIVALNPDSTLDKLRLNQLRNTLVLHAQPNRPDRRIAIVGAVATVVLVGCVAAILARSTATPKTDPNLLASNAQESTQTDGQVQFYEPPAKTDSPPANAAPQNATPPTANPTPTANPAPQTEAILPPATRGNELPAPEGTIETEIRPVTPPSPPTKEPTDTNPKPPSRQDDPPTGTQVSSGAKTPEEDPGEIKIEVSRGNGNRANSGGSGGGTQGAEMYSRVGREQFQLGNYSGAASNYERALSSGADPVSTNQRLAQTYERLGRSSDAKAAYTRALGAAEAAIASGRGNKDRLQMIADSCRQALRVLQGG